MSRSARSRSFLLVTSLLGAAPLFATAACVQDSAHSSSNNPITPSGTSPSAGQTPGGQTATAPNPDGGAPIALASTSIVITSETIDVAGTPRSFVLAAPSTYDATKSYALILALHGDGESGATMQQMLHMEDVSQQNAFVAYPTGGNSTWDLYDPSATNPDDAFITSLVDTLRSRFSIDQAHVFGMGLSSGAFMINELACRQSSLFRAIAPHSGGAPSEPHDPNAGTWGAGLVKCVGQTNGPAALVMHGTSDTTVPIESGDFTATYWATVNGCGTTRSPSSLPSCVQQDGCPGNYPVLYCPIDNLGHTLWSDAATTAWSFFSNL